MDEVVTELQNIQDCSYFSEQMINNISEKSYEQTCFKLVIQNATDQAYSDLEDVSLKD